MERIEYKEIIERMIKGKSRYRASKEIGKDIRGYIGKDVRISTIIKISKAMGYHIVLTNGKEGFEIDG